MGLCDRYQASHRTRQPSQRRRRRGSRATGVRSPDSLLVVLSHYLAASGIGGFANRWRLPELTDTIIMGMEVRLMNHEYEYWLAKIDNCEPVVSNRADSLVATTGSADGIAAMARQLGAEIIRLPGSLKPESKGLLSRPDQRWLIGVGGSLDGGLSPEQQFTVAHELAHLLFIDQGLRQPCDEVEYWLLEDACDRIAQQLLGLTAEDESSAPASLAKEAN